MSAVSNPMQADQALDRIYQELAKKYKTHTRGFFILAPSGAGKTHFVKSQTVPNWLDGDELWIRTGAHPDSPWWEAGEGSELVFEVDKRSDIVTEEAKKRGFWIIGASNYSLPPDAIVIPDWDIHQSWILRREKESYDGGAKSGQLASVLKHRERILGWEKKGVPRFDTVESAVSFLERQ